MNKNLMIGLGVLAVAGIAYYMYKKPKATTTTTETKANAIGKRKATVRNPIPSDLIRPCGGATVQGHYKCCKSGEGFVGYSLYSSCENLVPTLPSEG
jgi:hypothetical protein